MTRLSTQDLAQDFTPEDFAEFINDSLKTDIFGLAGRAWDLDPATLKASIKGKKVAAISITSGEGAIGGFAQMVAAVGTMMGAEARVMDNTDDKGFQEAENWQADIVIYSDDVDFVAQDAQSKHVIHNNPATSRIFVAALEFLNEKSLKGETVLILGLGPIGFWAVERLMELGARPLCYDIDLKKLFRMSKMLPGADLIYNQKSLEGNISRFSKPIIFEAVPEKIILADNRMEELLQDTNPIVSAPGVPLSWPQSWLYSGDKGRLFHEPLMAGTASMLAGLFVEDYLPRFSFSYSFFFSSE